MLKKVKRFVRRKICYFRHMKHWELVKHGHRRCSKCQSNWYKGSGVKAVTSARHRQLFPKG